MHPPGTVGPSTVERRRHGPLPGLRAQRVLERNLLVSKRTWVVLFSGFFEPIFYLFSIGVGVGALVGDLDVPGVGPVQYRVFVPRPSWHPRR